MRKKFTQTLLLTGMLASLATLADGQPLHPRYLHARTDLRTAQMFLRVHDEPNVMAHVHAVDYEIDRAVAEIDQAAVIDHKDIVDVPPIDRALPRTGRFGKAMELLRAARADIDEAEDRSHSRYWRNHAIEHIDRAIRQLKEAAATLHMDHMEGF